MSPVWRSNDQRQGFRRPLATISHVGVRRGRVGRADELAQERAHVLAGAERVLAAATVAEARVERAVRAELELASVVVEDGIVDREQMAPGRHDHVLAVRLDLVDAEVVVGVDVVDVEQVVGRVARAERDREDALVAVVVPHDAAEVGKEVGPARLPVQEHRHLACDLDHVDVVRALRRGDVRHGSEPACDRPEAVAAPWTAPAEPTRPRAASESVPTSPIRRRRRRH